MNWCNPDLLPDADPVGSTRYENVLIIHTKIPCPRDSVIMGFDETKKTFYVCDHSPEHVRLKQRAFCGTVLKEEGEYSWWRSLKQEG